VTYSIVTKSLVLGREIPLGGEARPRPLLKSRLPDGANPDAGSSDETEIAEKGRTNQGRGLRPPPDRTILLDGFLFDDHARVRGDLFVQFDRHREFTECL
jgi:hypothetical protein